MAMDASVFSAEMDTYLEEYYKVNQISGRLRVTVKDNIIYQKDLGFADRENRIPFNEQSMFTLYSLSKPFCAIALLLLKDKGLVELDVHPGVYVPEAKAFDERVTIRQLLLHTSGVPDFDQHTDYRARGMDGTSGLLRGQLKALAKLPMLFVPGTEARYTNINFILCALIVENVSGMRYADYMKKMIFEPLGMRRARIDEKGLVVAERVKGYLYQEQIAAIDRVTDWILGAADVLATVDDVYCLNKAIKHRLLLKEETWKEVLTPSPLNSMGMGCTVSEWHGKKRITHNGGWDGFRTLHIQLPEEDFDIIFLSNSGWGDARAEFAEKIYETYYGGAKPMGERVKMDVGYI